MKDGLDMRTSTIFFLFATLQFILLGLITANAVSKKMGYLPQLNERRVMAEKYEFSSPSLFADTHYTMRAAHRNNQ